jgi:hypothetical protein
MQALKAAEPDNTALVDKLKQELEEIKTKKRM